MSEIQRDAYDDATEIGSDPLHLIDRDNRNHRKKQRLILEYARADPGDPLLEVGCGHGIHAKRYANRHEYVGVDISQSLVEQTQARLPSGTALQMDASELAFDDGQFSAVVGTAILHHIADQAATLQEWVRVTESEGSVTLMEPNPIFPKDLVQTFTDPKERHKRGMFPWRLRETLEAVDGVSWTLEPHIHTLPWPARLHGIYDQLDNALTGAPVVQWSSQMLLIHLDVA